MTFAQFCESIGEMDDVGRGLLQCGWNAALNQAAKICMENAGNRTECAAEVLNLRDESEYSKWTA